MFLPCINMIKQPVIRHKDIEGQWCYTENFRFTKELQPNTGEVRNKLLLDEEEDGQPAWFLAAKSDNVKLLEDI